MRRALLVSTAVVSLLAPPALVAAAPDQDKAEARREFDAGVEADKRHDYAGALDHYLRANDLLEHPFTIFNIATDYERLGKLREAASWYTRYLDKTTDPADQAKVRDKLADLEVRPGMLTIRTAFPGGRAFVDERPVGPTPLVTRVTGGPHHVTVEVNGQHLERDVRVQYGEAVAVDMSAPAAAPQAAGTLIVFGAPAGATVYVDGQPSGTLPTASVQTTAGAHEVRVVAAGYAPFDQPAEVAPGGFARVPVELHPGADGGAGSGSTEGGLAGYYFGGGLGGDLTGKGLYESYELGVTLLGKLDLGVGAGKLGDDALVQLTARYAFSTGRVAPFIGVSYLYASGNGVQASAGLRYDLLRGPTFALTLLAQASAMVFSPSSDETPGLGSDTSSSGTQTAFPISVSLIGTYGKRMPTAQAATAPVQGPP